MIGVVGLGIMGSAMATNLMRAGYGVQGYDVLASRRQRLRRGGGQAARDARDVGRAAGVVICSLPSAEALLHTATALADGVARATKSRRRPPIVPVVIETSTLPIAVKERAREILAGAGTTLLDCPVSGTGPQARSKDLVVFASGDRGAYRRVVPIIKGFARSQHYIGAFGTGSRMKFVANLLVAIHNVAAAEALVLGMKAGLDPAKVFEVIADGAGSSRMLQVRGPLMVKGDYSKAMMKLGLWQKDMRIIAEFARELRCPTPLFTATEPLYAAAIASRPDTDDAGAVCTVLEERAGVVRRRTGLSLTRSAKRPSFASQATRA